MAFVLGKIGIRCSTGENLVVAYLVSWLGRSVGRLIDWLVGWFCCLLAGRFFCIFFLEPGLLGIFIYLFPPSKATEACV